MTAVLKSMEKIRPETFAKNVKAIYNGLHLSFGELALALQNGAYEVLPQIDLSKKDRDLTIEDKAAIKRYNEQKEKKPLLFTALIELLSEESRARVEADPDFQALMQNRNNPLELWRIIEKTHTAIHLQFNLNLEVLKDLVSMKQTKIESTESFIVRFHRRFEEYTATGGEISQKLLGGLLILAVEPEINDEFLRAVKTGIRTDANLLSYDKLRPMAIALARTLQLANGTAGKPTVSVTSNGNLSVPDISKSGQQPMIGQATVGLTISANMDGEPIGKPRKKKFKPDSHHSKKHKSNGRCDHCGKDNHTEDRCWEMYPEKRPKNNNKTSYVGFTEAVQDPQVLKKVVIC